MNSTNVNENIVQEPNISRDNSSVVSGSDISREFHSGVVSGSDTYLILELEKLKLDVDKLKEHNMNSKKIFLEALVEFEEEKKLKKKLKLEKPIKRRQYLIEVAKNAGFDIDILQMKNIIIHEEYLKRIQRFKFNNITIHI